MSQRGGSIPLRDLLGDPVRAEAQLSPAGEHLAYLAPWRRRMNVWVRPLGSDDDRLITRDDTRSIPTFRWTRDGRQVLHLQDAAGDENFHLFITDVERGPDSTRNLTPFDGVRAELLALPYEAPGSALVGLNRRNPTEMDVWELELETGDLTLLARNPGRAMHFVSDREGNVRACRRELEGGHHELLVLDDGQWQTLRRYDRDDRGIPLAVTPDSGRLWVDSADGSDTGRLVEVDLTTGEEVATVDHHPEYDLWELVKSDRSGELLAAVYRGHAGLIIHPLDDHFARDLERLRQLHAGDPIILSSDDDETMFVVRFEDDRDPGVTYLYRRDSGDGELLYRPYPALDPSELAPMRPVTVTSRDDLPLRCYLTLPPGSGDEDLPAVLWVHGGPWDRDVWGYHPVIQALANRGYAVMQVNYRGSVGFGKAFVTAAVGEWAGRMHDDLLDAVDWLVNKRIADPERIAIAGESYGGYAALVGLAFTPEVFAAGYSIVGPSNLETVIRSFPPYWKPFLENSFYRHCGNPERPEDLEQLHERSPLFRADQIVRPLGITQTVNDPRVPKRESDQIVEALHNHGVDVDYLVIDEEGHGFQNAENRLRVYEHLLAFLNRHIGAPARDRPADEATASTG